RGMIAPPEAGLGLKHVVGRARCFPLSSYVRPDLANIRADALHPDETRRWFVNLLRAPGWRYPTTGDAGCCARAASGHAATAPPRSVMTSRRLRSVMGPSSRRVGAPQ